MKNVTKRIMLLSGLVVALSAGVHAQSFEWISSTEGRVWQSVKVKLQTNAEQTPLLTVDGAEEGTTFKAWGTCFNELGWDALNMLPRNEQESILRKLFAPDGDLKFTLGRFSMNANDYARDWYSCDEVSGDFQLKHFNIKRDQTTLIPFIKAAQQYNPNMTFWTSPWSPPSWLKINHYYSVRSDRNQNEMAPLSDVALFENQTEKNAKVFPQQLAVNDYLIQDPRYLQTYADYFCKFVDAYKEQGIPVSMVMFQNEAWSYTNYPGCAWTPEGIIRFHTEYLQPTLKKRHPEVALYFGTINTNRFDFIDQVLSDPRMRASVQGIGLQWEGRQILAKLRAKYPEYKYVQSESECGWGSFDWKAAEHTFELMNHYLGNGCEEYTFWNAILADGGFSGWGWKQNSLIHVDSKAGTATFTPEYYAVKHYSHYILPDSKIVSYKAGENDKTPILVVMTPQQKRVITVGNFNHEVKEITLKLGKRYLNATLQPHSLNTFVEN